MLQDATLIYTSFEMPRFAWIGHLTARKPSQRRYRTATIRNVVLSHTNSLRAAGLQGAIAVEA
jgi:hypothetical protein